MFKIVKSENNSYSDKSNRRGVKGAAMLLSISVLSGAMGFGGGLLANSIVGNDVPVHSINATPVSLSGSGFSAVSVEESCADSVVEIRTESVQNDIRFGQFVSEGAGSGVIVTSDGYIATNNHVIDGASKISVTLASGKEYPATLIGKDAKTDLAVIKISETSLKAATLGTSASLKVGEPVVAIGNPLGELGGTVTLGIISALDRQIEIDNEKMTLLQTDAAVNPGNSGGGLFNANGQLIGIVNAKSSGSDIEGLAFAIPIDTAKNVINQIISQGYVSGRIDLGLTFKEQGTSFNLFTGAWTRGGVYIAEVTSNSNAANAGLRRGDIVTMVDGQKISGFADIKKIIDSHSVSDMVSFTVYRNGQSLTISFRLQEAKLQTTPATLY
ncbi:MAG: trypsin-like peptidase domain-containing protein [Oscillospiraceae bacterium]|nr:trypsin-like peptidase domain-containing protein [Oscillospiraceae bacterium]